MSVAHVPLYLGAFFIIVLTAILLVGSFIGLASLLLRLVLPARRTKAVTVTAVAAANPPVAEAGARTRVETYGQVGAEYVGC